MLILLSQSCERKYKTLVGKGFRRIFYMKPNTIFTFSSTQKPWHFLGISACCPVLSCILFAFLSGPGGVSVKKLTGCHIGGRSIHHNRIWPNDYGLDQCSPYDRLFVHSPKIGNLLNNLA
jgi:hypothetical protein